MKTILDQAATTRRETGNVTPEPLNSKLPVEPDLNQPSVSTSSSPQSLFLLGSARGGTSWALKVLDAHPLVYGCHEPFMQIKESEFTDLVRRLMTRSGTAEDVQRFQKLVTRPRLGTQKPPFFSKKFLWTPARIRSGLWAASKMARPIEAIFRTVSTGRLDARHYIVMKNRPFHNLDVVLEALQTKSLILVRHPCAVVSSWWQGIQMNAMNRDDIDPAKSWRALSQQIEPLGFTEEQLQRFSPISLLALHWLSDQILFERIEAGPTDSRVIVYEDAARDPVPQWRAVYDWMGLPFAPSVERFLTTSARPMFELRSLLGKRYDYFSVYREKDSTLETWKRKLKPEEIQEILELVRPHINLARYWPSDT